MANSDDDGAFLNELLQRVSAGGAEALPSSQAAHPIPVLLSPLAAPMTPVAVEASPQRESSSERAVSTPPSNALPVSVMQAPGMPMQYAIVPQMVPQYPTFPQGVSYIMTPQGLAVLQQPQQQMVPVHTPQGVQLMPFPQPMYQTMPQVQYVAAPQAAPPPPPPAQARQSSTPTNTQPPARQPPVHNFSHQAAPPQYPGSQHRPAHPPPSSGGTYHMGHHVQPTRYQQRHPNSPFSQPSQSTAQPAQTSPAVKFATPPSVPLPPIEVPSDHKGPRMPAVPIDADVVAPPSKAAKEDVLNPMAAPFVPPGCSAGENQQNHDAELSGSSTVSVTTIPKAAEAHAPSSASSSSSSTPTLQAGGSGGNASTSNTPAPPMALGEGDDAPAPIGTQLPSRSSVPLAPSGGGHHVFGSAASAAFAHPHNPVFVIPSRCQATNADGRTVYRCPVCDQSDFLSEYVMRSHLRARHGSDASLLVRLSVAEQLAPLVRAFLEEQGGGSAELTSVVQALPPDCAAEINDPLHFEATLNTQDMFVIFQYTDSELAHHKIDRTVADSKQIRVALYGTPYAKIDGEKSRAASAASIAFESGGLSESSSHVVEQATGSLENVLA